MFNLKSLLGRPTKSEWTGELRTTEIAFNGGQKRPMVYRHTMADSTVLEQIFESRQYNLANLGEPSQHIKRRYESLVAAGQKPFILDAGANIGASAVFFCREYPQSRVVCFEPAADNFELLEQNTRGLDVELHRAAIGAEDGTLTLYDPGEGAWGYRSSEDPGSRPVATIDVRSIANVVAAQVAKGLAPFIVKIDIEGAEQHLFDASTDWIDNVPVLMIELHDWMFPAKGISRGFLTWSASRQRDFMSNGETIISIDHAIYG